MKTYFTVCRIDVYPVISRQVVPANRIFVTEENEQLVLYKHGKILKKLRLYKSADCAISRIKYLYPSTFEIFVDATCTFVPNRFKQIPCLWCTEKDNCHEEECQQNISEM